MSVLSKILKAPLQLLIICAWLASFYVAYTHMQGMTWSGPIMMTGMVVLYIIGLVLERRKTQNE